MEMNLSYMVIGLIAIVLAAAVVTVALVTRSRRATNLDDIVARLDSIDARIGAVEKTLTEIP